MFASLEMWGGEVVLLSLWDNRRVVVRIVLELMGAAAAHLCSSVCIRPISYILWTVACNFF